MFRLSDVRLAVNGRTLINGVYLRLEAGRLHGIIGPNGAGKSSLLRLLAGELAPSSGTIHLSGTPLATLFGRERARRIAHLPQTPPPAEAMTLEELVRLGRYPWTGAFRRLRSADHSAVAEAMRASGVVALSARLVGTLSGGERQRGWIAMMLAQSADALLLDEPTGALDLRYQVGVRRLLRGLARRPGSVAAVVLHDINLAARFCDGLVALEDGRILAEGPVEEVMRSGILSRLYGLPMRVIADPETGKPVALPEGRG